MPSERTLIIITLTPSSNPYLRNLLLQTYTIFLFTLTQSSYSILLRNVQQDFFIWSIVNTVSVTVNRKCSKSLTCTLSQMNKKYWREEKKYRLRWRRWKRSNRRKRRRNSIRKMRRRRRRSRSRRRRKKEKEKKKEKKEKKKGEGEEEEEGG